ncbi:hypothetical protein [Xenorhabdus bovienii]|uniref:hypothetical protein n=1 Tax=Xenorhabdus bovienii TaxID=40576 RepID=UPI003DA4A273
MTSEANFELKQNIIGVSKMEKIHSTNLPETLFNNVLKINMVGVGHKYADYQVGDFLIIRELDYTEESLTGKNVLTKITGLKPISTSEACIVTFEKVIPVNSFSNEIKLTTPMKNSIYCKENYLRYREWVRDSEPRSSDRRSFIKLAWNMRQNYREWAAIS